MRVLVIHNFYRSENASGENLSVLDEIEGLRNRNWDVEVLSADSDVITDGDVPLADLAIRPIYSRRSVRRVRESIRRFRPHVALVENLFPLHSPWVVKTLHEAQVPVAAGVRSYRMLCAKSTLYRDGAACRACLTSRWNLPAIRHGCYQSSPIKTAPMALSLALHRSTFASIDRYLAVSDYVRDELIDAGFDAERIVVRPNFVDDPGPPDSSPGDGFLFAGRLTEDKGVAPMLDGWVRSEVWRHQTLHVAGTGPLDELVREHADRGVVPLGLVPHEQILDVVRTAAVTVVPSTWPEPFGRGVIEAAARGRASLVSNGGGVASLVDDGVTGWTTEATPDGLADGFRRAADLEAQRRFGDAARRRFLERYTRDASIGVLDRELSVLATSGVGHD
ncbi:MAG: glycosyltransferase [Ilumatobacter sp.]|uniref:glycosyltransferase n=1 Tax=Ilumatobacter sp. TaxID=1967498 RepID=UPI00391CE7B8